MLLTLVVVVLLATSWLLVFFSKRSDLPGPDSHERTAGRADHPARGPKTASSGPGASAVGTSPAATVPVQLVFAESSGGAVWIDCILQAPVALPDQMLARGHPMTLRCGRPDGWSIDDAVGDVLERWAHDGRTVSLEFFIAEGEPRVRLRAVLDEQATTLQLDLERAVA